ncbi:hypothetical protein ES704_01966 [subsurface metagenome]|jgi:hypothetical protein
MTKEEILAMGTGQVLNAWVAEQIFDCFVVTGFCGCSTKSHRDYRRATYELTMMPYSTDISAAWQVWEMTNFDCVWRIVNPDKIQYAVGYACGVHNDLIRYHRGGNLDDYLSPVCNSFPEAICKAALLAKLEETG